MPATEGLAPANAAGCGFHLVDDEFDIAKAEADLNAGGGAATVGAAPSSGADLGFHLVDDGFEEEKPVYKSKLKRVDPARLRTKLVVEDDGVYDPYGNETERADASTPASYTYPEKYGPPPVHDAENADPAPADDEAPHSHAAPPHAAALTTVRLGPVFDQIDAKLNARHSTWTDAQKSEYFKSVTGTQVTWQGNVVEVSMDHGGRVTLKCNPETVSSDTNVELNGAQVDRLVRLCKNQRISVVGILCGHDESGYTIVDARVLNI